MWLQESTEGIAICGSKNQRKALLYVAPRIIRKALPYVALRINGLPVRPRPCTSGEEE